MGITPTSRRTKAHTLIIGRVIDPIAGHNQHKEGDHFDETRTRGEKGQDRQ